MDSLSDNKELISIYRNIKGHYVIGFDYNYVCEECTDEQIRILTFAKEHIERELARVKE